MMLPTARAALAAPAAAATSPYVATRPGGIRRTAVSTFWRKAPEVIQHPPRTGKATEEGHRRRPQKNTEEHRFGSGSSRRDVHDLNQCLSVAFNRVYLWPLSVAIHFRRRLRREIAVQPRSARPPRRG